MATSMREDIDIAIKKGEELAKWATAREDASTSEGIKALLAINGGGIVAMLGFMQALLMKCVFAEFAWYGKNALLCFATGIVFAALVPALRVADLNNTMGGKGLHRHWEYCLYVSWFVSLGLFVAGAAWAGFGVDNMPTRLPLPGLNAAAACR